KLYSSTHRTRDPAKAQKDLVQAVTLAAILIEQDSVSLRESFAAAPQELRSAARARLPQIESLLAQHPQALDGFRELR
ncbi:MAG: hypothetical protein M3O41_10805, partial [Pseudomonadota bacterium]|nr:hypothetical protein [Pseudomonadota bacterium]